MHIYIYICVYKRWRIKEKDSKNSKKGKEERDDENMIEGMLAIEWFLGG